MDSYAVAQKTYSLYQQGEQYYEPAATSLKIRLKQPYAEPVAASMSEVPQTGILLPQDIKAKRQHKSKAHEDEGPAKRPRTNPSTMPPLPPNAPAGPAGPGPSSEPPPKPRLGRPPGRPNKVHNSDGTSQGGKRAGSVPAELSMSIDLASLLKLKDQKPRTWVRQWVEVKTLIGNGRLKVMRWVPEGPPKLPQVPRTVVNTSAKFNRNISTDSLAGMALQDNGARSASDYSAAARNGAGNASASTGPAANGSPSTTILGPDGMPVQMFPCSYPGCKKMFPSMASMRKHAHMHSEKTFICDHPGCTKAFVDASKLKRHKMVHTNEKPFKCPYCSKEFALEFNMRTHIKTIHPEMGLQHVARSQAQPVITVPPALTVGQF